MKHNEYRNLIEHFEAAVRAHELLGSRDPVEHEAIEREYNNSKQQLIESYKFLRAFAQRCFKEKIDGI